MIWVYALCDRPDIPLPRRRGLAQAPLEGLVDERLVAAFTRHAHSPVEPAPDALWAHEQVVERLMADRAVLPMRFGTTFEDEQGLRAALAGRHHTLEERLDRVRGRVELGLRVVATGDGDEPEPEPSTGRDYVLAKLNGGRRADRVAETVHAPLTRLAVDAHRHGARGGGEVLRAAYLVEAADVARFRSAVERLAAANDDLALLCTGPWPPYAFVT